MKKYILFFSLLSISIYANEQGLKLFEKNCKKCHFSEIPQDKSKMKAPPAFAITMHVKQKNSTLKEFSAFVKDYVIKPSKEKSLCAKKTIKRFGLMPSLKGKIKDKELEAIAKYLYDNFANHGTFEENHKILKEKMHPKKEH